MYSTKYTALKRLCIFFVFCLPCPQTGPVCAGHMCITGEQSNFFMNAVSQCKRTLQQASHLPEKYTQVPGPDGLPETGGIPLRDRAGEYSLDNDISNRHKFSDPVCVYIMGNFWILSIDTLFRCDRIKAYQQRKEEYSCRDA